MTRQPQNELLPDTCFGELFDLSESSCTICLLQAECGKTCFEQVNKVDDEYLDLFIVEKKLPEHLLNIIQ